MKKQVIKSLVKNNRSYRRFDSEESVSRATLSDLIDTARYVPSAMNLQVLRYIPVSSEESRENIFRTLKWAGYLKEWSGPATQERPSAYIVILRDKRADRGFWQVDLGISAQTIMLHAVEKGLGGCMIWSFDRSVLAEELNVQEEFEPVLVLALGKPSEQVVITEMKDNEYKYYRDVRGTHFVPKRPLGELIVKE